METTSTKIRGLVEKIEKGEIRLPEMQRGYVWKAAKVCDLLDSLYRDYPSGTILLWETDKEVATRESAISQNKGSMQKFQLLLDGQQRLTSLLAVISGKPIHVKDRKNPIEIMFNLDHPDELSFITEEEDENEEEETVVTKEEEKQRKQKRLESMTFAVKSKQLEKLSHWVPVTEAFKAENPLEFLKDIGAIDDSNDQRFSKYLKRLVDLDKIKEYPYGVQVLDHEKTYEEVTDIFVRVNSLGMQLKSTDLALAQITAKWTDSLKIFEEYQDSCTAVGFDFPLGVFIKNLISFAAGESKFKVVAGLSKERLETAWEESNKGFDYAMNFLKKNIGIDSPALLTSPSILISVAYFAHHQNYNISAENQAKLRYWVLVANAHGRYSSGSSENILDQDLKEIRSGKGLEGMIERLREKFGRLEIVAINLKNKSSSSSYFKTMFLAFSKDGAKDWNTGLGISLNHSGKQHKLQFHHIFPKSLLEKQTDDTQKINDICNLAFIGGKTNRDINNKQPSVYLPKIMQEQGEEALTAQQIPIDKTLWEMDSYDDFLEKRRDSVVKKLNDFLGHDKIK